MSAATCLCREAACCVTLQLSGGPDAIERLQQGADVKLLPSAPPMQVSLSTVLDGHDDLMSLEPPTWLPDSCATACEHCTAPFQ